METYGICIMTKLINTQQTQLMEYAVSVISTHRILSLFILVFLYILYDSWLLN